MGPDSQLRPCGPTRHWTWPGGAVAAFGHGVSSQLVPGGVQGEVLELRRHLFPFLGPLVEAQRLQQAADLVRLHFLHGNRLTCQEGDTRGCTHARTHTHFGHMVNGFRSRSACVEKNADMQNFTGLVVVCTFDAFCTFYILLRFLCQCLFNQPLSRTQI